MTRRFSSIAPYAVLAASAFLLNALWENLHYVLYVHYKGGPITEGILLHAAFADMIYIAVVVACVRALRIPYSMPALACILILLAIVVEWWALATGRWAYSSSMPIVPLIRTGLSPTVQLACTTLFAYRIAFGRRLLTG